MNNKGFTDERVNIETPNDVPSAEKPLKTRPKTLNRVDINILKSKLQKSQNKEFKKNLFVLSSLVFVLGLLGIYLTI